MSKPRALITGITGQDGAYLSRFLLDKGYDVFGTIRRTSSENFWRLEYLGVKDQISIVLMDLGDFANIQRVIAEVRPQEIYNLGAQSFVAASFDQPLYTADISGTATTRILEAIRMVDPGIRFYQASTSEMFGLVQQVPQTESTPFYPRSPYGAAKMYAHWMTVNYREAYGLYASSGILFNHESPLRGSEFVTRKITSGLAAIASGFNVTLELGNLSAQRDWGFAGDFVQGMWLMLQQDIPGDYVLATGKTTTVREFTLWAAEAAGLRLAWEGNGVAERAIDIATNRVIITVNPKFFRPSEVDLLVGDAQRARKTLGWEPNVSARQLAELMVEADLQRLSGSANQRSPNEQVGSYKSDQVKNRGIG